MFEFVLYFEKIKIIILFLLMTSLNIISVLPLSSSSPSSLSTTPSLNNHQTVSNLCGQRHITLDYEHPEHLIQFPVTSIQSGDKMDYRHSRSDVIDNEEKQKPAHSNFYLNNDDFVYDCKWLVATDSYHKIRTTVKIENKSEYHLSIADENGLMKNCTSKTCTFESDTPVIQLRFLTRRVNLQPATRFSAKIFTLPIYADRSGAVIISLWILLVALSAVLIVFTTVIYLFCMKRKMLFSQILNVLRLKNNNKKGTETRKKTITLPNGTKVTLTNSPRQQRCSANSAPLNSFERMPTILEETENDSESRASSRQLSESLRKISSHHNSMVAEKSSPTFPSDETMIDNDTSRTEQLTATAYS